MKAENQAKINSAFAGLSGACSNQSTATGDYAATVDGIVPDSYKTSTSQTEIDNASSDLAKLQERMEVLTGNVKDMETKLDAETKKVDGLLAALDTAIQNLSDAMEAEKTGVAAATKRVDDANAQVGIQTDAVNRYTGEVNGLQGEVKKHEGNIKNPPSFATEDQLNSYLATERDKLDAVKTSLSDSQAKLNKAKTGLDNARSEQKDAIADLAKTKKTLADNVSAARSAVSDARGK